MCAKVIMALALVTAVVTGVDPGAIFASVHAINVVLKHNRDIAEGIPSAE
jgi:predicted HAD superfamily Cof-like phosphohydrolase